MNLTISHQPTFSRYPEWDWADFSRPNTALVPPRLSDDSQFTIYDVDASLRAQPRRSTESTRQSYFHPQRRAIGVSNRQHEPAQENLSHGKEAQIERTRKLTLWTRIKAFLGLDFHHWRVSKNKNDAFTLVDQSLSHGFASVKALNLEQGKVDSNRELLKQKRDDFAQDALNTWELTTAVRSMEATEHEIFMRKCEFIKVFFIIVAGLIGMATFYYAILKPQVGN